MKQVRQIETNIVCSHLYEDSKKAELIEIEKRMVASRGLGLRLWGDVVQTSSHKINKIWGSN